MFKNAVAAVLFVAIQNQAMAQESEDWSDIVNVDEVEVFFTSGGESATFVLSLEQPLPLDSNSNILCGQFGAEILFDSGPATTGGEPNCRPEIRSGVALNGTLTSLQFNRTQSDQMRTLFGDELIDLLLARQPNQTTIRLYPPLPIDLLPQSLISDQILQLYPNQYRIRAQFENSPVLRLGDVARYSSVLELEERLDNWQIDAQQVNSNTVAIADHGHRISMNESSIAANRTDIDRNRSDIDRNRTDIDQNRSDISRNRTDINQNRSDIDRNRTDIDQNRSDIDVHSELIQTNVVAISTNAARISANSAAIGVNSAQIAHNMQEINMLQQSMVGLDTRVTGLENQVGENRTGIAIAMAMSGGVGLQPGETFRVNANWGTWDGDNAVAVSGTYRASRRFMINAAAGSGSDGEKFGGRAGISFGW